MRSIFRIAGFVFTIVTIIIIPLSSQAEDGVTLRATGVPKGGTPPEQMSSKDWADPDELKLTWDGAKIRIPLRTGVINASMINLRSVPTGKKFPTVIYMHGCNGFHPGTDRRVDFLAKLNFAAIAPNSFAREKVPSSCEPMAHKAGMYRSTLIMRQNEAQYAIQEARKLSWVDGKNIFLMGHSEGGITAATFTGEPVKARIIEGWGCHASWPEYHGLNAPKTEPVLSIIGDKDPWLQNPALQGDCGEFMLNDASKSIVFKSGYIRFEHFLFKYPEVKKIVRKFLGQHVN
ncbi:MAG: dienelactone hydrolase family protein [Nitrospinales bacterium]